MSSTVHEAAPALPVVDLLGVLLHAIDREECVRRISARVAAGQGGWMLTPNLDHVRRHVRDQGFRDLCADADLSVVDGVPLMWAARLQGTPLPERVAGSDLIWSLSAESARRGFAIYLLGGDPGTAEGAAKVLSERYPGLRVAGVHCPPLGFEQDERQRAEIARQLGEAQPGIVFLALGSPKQEKLIREMRAVLPGSWWLGVGISFSFVTGRVKRAPRWMQRSGLEWAHRLAQEPRRLARRYLWEGLPFALLMLARCAGRGLRARSGVRG